MSLLATLARQSLAQFVIVYKEIYNGSAIPPEELDALMWAKMCAKEANITPCGFKIPFDNIRRAKVTLPYLPDLINYTGCSAIKKNGGLYTPCCGKIDKDSFFCKTCSVDKEGNTKDLEFGSIDTREANIEDESFAPISFGEWMKGHKTTLPEVYEKLREAGIPLEVPASELTVRDLPKRRKGRPTRSEDSVEDEDSVPKKAKKAKADSDEEPKAKKTKAKKAESDEEPKKAKKAESDEEPKKAKKAPKAESESESEAEPKAKAKAKKAESDDEAPKKAKKTKAAEPKAKKAPKAESEDDAPKKAKKAPKAESDAEEPKKAKKAPKAESESEAEEPKAKAKKAPKADSEDEAPKKAKKPKATEESGSDSDAKAAKAAKKAAKKAAEEAEAKATKALEDGELEEEDGEIEGEYEQDCEIDGKDYNLRNGKIICDKENGEILGSLNEEGEPEWNSEKR